MLTCKDIFQNQLHAYTITHAIEDKNVLRFHIDYFKPEKNISVGSTEHKKAIANAMIKKHNAATHNKRFNALFATASINDAIEYYELFKVLQQLKINEDENYIPLNIACVFSPPAQLIAKEMSLLAFKEDPLIHEISIVNSFASSAITPSRNILADISNNVPKGVKGSYSPATLLSI